MPTGVLKAKVGGTWVPITGPGQGVPAGGAAGDVLLKNTVSNYDARWTTTIPKLTLGGEAAQFPTALTIAEPNHATSDRAKIQFGTGWELGQDFAGNGTKDLFIYNWANTNVALKIDTSGKVFSLGYAGQTDVYIASIQTTGNLATAVRISSDGSWLDMHAKTDAYVDGDNIYFRTAAYGAKVTMSSNGFVYFNGSNFRIGYDGESRIVAHSATMTLNADNFQVLNTASSAWKFRHNGSTWESWGTWNNYGGMYCDSSIYCGSDQWFRARGNGGIYWESWGGGWQMTDSTWIRVYNNKSVYVSNVMKASSFEYDLIYPSSAGQRIRFYSSGDDNHHIRYSNDAASTIHPSSGVGSNGPWLQGYSTVCLRTLVNSRTWLFEQSGNAFTPNSWTTYSSVDNKESIESLDPVESLAQVKQWRPIRFRRKDDGVQREGFTAEEMFGITPTAVSLTGEDDKPTGIDYGHLSVRLTGAVQALLARIEELERKVAA